MPSRSKGKLLTQSDIGTRPGLFTKYTIDKTILTSGVGEGYNRTAIFVAFVHALLWAGAITFAAQTANKMGKSKVEAVKPQMKNLALIMPIVYGVTLAVILAHAMAICRGDRVEAIAAFGVIAMLFESMILSSTNLSFAANTGPDEYLFCMLAVMFFSAAGGMALAFLVYFTVNGRMKGSV